MLWVDTHPAMQMEKRCRLCSTEAEHLEKVVVVLDNYHVEGEYWLQNISEVVGLLLPHHLYGEKTTHRVEQRYI